MKRLLITVTLVAFAFATGGTLQANDVKITIEREVGILPRQLLEYEWGHEYVGAMPTNVLDHFRFWVNATISKQFAPPETAPFIFHHHGRDTCDAIQMNYETNGLLVSIAQTRQTMFVVVKGLDTIVSDQKDADAVANRIAQRIFALPQPFSLVVTHAFDGFWVGEAKQNHPRIEGSSEFMQQNINKGGFVFDHWW